MGPLSFDGSPSFMELPVELRLKIYSLVFRDSALDYSIIEATKARQTPRALKLFLRTPIEERSLLCMNRQCRQEGLALFYRESQLVLHGWGWSATRIKALLPRVLRQEIRYVTSTRLYVPMLTRPSIFPAMRSIHLPSLSLSLKVPERRIEDVNVEDRFWHAWRVFAQDRTSALSLYGERVLIIRLITLRIKMKRGGLRETHKVSCELERSCWATGANQDL